MTFRSFGRIALALVFSVGLCTLPTSCGGGHSLGFAYVIGANPCSIYIYNVNSQNGALSQASTPSVGCPSGAGTPVSTVVSPDYKFLFVLYAQPDASGLIQAFSIDQNDGSITALSQTYATAGVASTALAIDPGGAYIYAVDTFAAGQNSGLGVLSFYTLSSGALTASACANGTVVNSVCSYPVGYNPIGATQLFNASYVYVANAGDQSISACSGSVSGFAVASGGLTPVAFSVPKGACPGGSIPTPANTLPMGVQPAGITSDPSSSFVYITDYVQAEVFANQVQTSNGNLSSSITGGVTGQGYPTGGKGPRNVIVDPRGQYVYISNSIAGTLTGFVLAKASGSLSSVSGGTYVVGNTPTCLAVEPLQGEFLYSLNQGSGNIYGFKLTGNTGQLAVTPNSPYPVSTSSASDPICLVTAANGPTPIPGSP